MKKININTKLVVALMLIIFALPACNDWLSIAPENDLIKDKFWSKKEDADGGLAAAYDAFRDAALESFIWGEVRADLVSFTGSSFASYENIAGSNISPSNDKIKWSKYYNAINLANTLMLYGDLVVERDNSFTPEMKKVYDSEALFIRAFSYFYLIRIWKEVPLVIEATVSDQGVLDHPKSSEKEIIAQIIKDLLKAKDMAVTDAYKDIPTYDKGRANKYSIMALLADAYLWNEQYEECNNYCDSIINTGKFGLEDQTNWFNLYNPGNSPIESIFEIQFDDNFDSQENPIYNDLIPITGTVRAQLNDVTMENLFTDSDFRVDAGFDPTWKYKSLNITGSRRSANQRDANFIYFRYADILLMKAEALSEMNQLIEANEMLSKTKGRAGLSHTPIVKKSDLQKEIIDERGREFIMEGKRWFDLLRNAKRNGFQNKYIIINMILSGADIKQQAILRTRVYDTMSYYLPIPENELLYNPNLDQNPFYDR